VIKGQVLAKLEALLERVRARAAEPRSGPASAAPLASGVMNERAPEPDLDDDAAGVRETAAPGRPEEELPPSDGFDSRERLVAAQPVAAVPPPPAVPAPTPVRVPEPVPMPEPEHVLRSEASAVGVIESSPPIEMTEIEVVTEEEEPPASSRRPVAPQPEERLAQMAFGAEEPPPLHTPPPESGRLPSAPADYDPDVTGVRHATPLIPRRNLEAAPLASPDLVPEATRPELSPNDRVADVILEAQRFAPPTFLALLDASLGL
jgi:hypothetical protein